MSDEARGKLLSAERLAELRTRTSAFKLDAEVFGHIDAIEASNRKLAETSTAYVMAIASGDGYDIARKYVALLAAIEDNDDV